MSLITKFNPEDGGSAASETLISNHQSTRRKNLENQEFPFLFYFLSLFVQRFTGEDTLT
jgi:hypothetical protein